MTEFFGFPKDGHTYSADEVGRALAGLFTREPDGSPRAGVLNPGVVVSAVSGAWKVQVGRFTYVHSVLGSVQLSGLSSPEEHDIIPAAGNIPAGQARIDVVGWNPETASVAILEGTPSSSPVAPSDVSVVPLAHVRVNSGDGAVLPGQISLVFSVTGLAESTDSEWTTLTLLNGFFNASDASPAAYRIQDGRIEFRGMLKRNTATPGWTKPFNLPVSILQRLERFAVQVYSGSTAAAGFIYRPDVAAGGPEAYMPIALGNSSALGVSLSAVSIALKD